MIFCIRRLGWLTRRWISRACLLVVLVGPLTIAADEAPTMRATFSDVVQYVQQQGWRVDLRDMCTKFELPRSGNDCIFRQLSLEDQREAGSAPRGFNVPAVSSAGPQYVLIFHLRPLAGEFFIVSPDGILMRAYLRFKGTDYSRVPNEEVQQEFDKNLAYWTTNLSHLKKGLEAERPDQK